MAPNPELQHAFDFEDSKTNEVEMSRDAVTSQAAPKPRIETEKTEFQKKVGEDIRRALGDDKLEMEKADRSGWK